MRKIFGIFLLFILAGLPAVYAQDSVKVASWTFTATKVSDVTYQLTFTGKINDGWHLFSTTATDDEPNTRVVLDSATAAIASVKEVKELGKLQQKPEPMFDNAVVRFFEHDVQLLVTIALKDAAVLKQPKANVKGTINFMALKGEDVVGPEGVNFKYVPDAAGNLTVQSTELKALNGQQLKIATIDLKRLDSGASKSLWGIFLLGFLGGLIGLFTPCVFPMIPLTVSFFTKKSGDKKKGIFNALLYGFFIFLIYVLLSLPFHFVTSLNPEILNNISTNIWLNLGFFVVFVVFALSFFGLFEITLPSSVANKADEKAGVGGVIGIFFMALTLALVSFSCTGPILGSLLAGSLSSDGGAMQLTAGMGGFGLALALPFAIFALFPGLLKSLPKSGGWLTSVKVVLGFVELALAVKFLSNADLVMHWNLVKRETFFAIWIVVGTCLALYLFGILKFRHDPPPKKLGSFRVGLGVVTAAFVLYLLPGVSNTKYANRALISGFPPPLSYSFYKREKGQSVEPNVINDYEKALALAKGEHKPLLIDFTGWACVNCRNMEENVWPEPAVKALIEQEFILVSLYVDDRKKLDDDQQFIYTTADGKQKRIVTVGDKYATLQSENFGSVSQPWYAIVSPDQYLMNKPVGYTPSATEYEAWLRAGLSAFKVHGEQ